MKAKGKFMIRKMRDGIEWLEFELLSEFSGLSHGILLRHGGFSSGGFESLNLGFTLDNELENKNVKENREKVKRVLGFSNFNDCKLEHRDKIVELNRKTNETRPVCDAISTSEPDISLFITHADCQAAIFYDPINNAIANVHAGWRGNVKNIYEQTIHHMKEKFGSSAANLHVGISPSLGPQNAEFINYKTELPESFWEYQVKPFYFDLWSIGKSQLLNAGILEHHLQITEICTLANPEDFFSYRREKITGRHGTFISLA